MLLFINIINKYLLYINIIYKYYIWILYINIPLFLSTDILCPQQPKRKLETLRFLTCRLRYLRILLFSSYMFLCVCFFFFLCAFKIMVCLWGFCLFACLFMTQRERERTWSWVSGEDLGGFMGRELWSEYIVWTIFFSKNIWKHFLRQGLTVYPWMTWSSLYIPRWP